MIDYPYYSHYLVHYQYAQYFIIWFGMYSMVWNIMIVENGILCYATV